MNGVPTRNELLRTVIESVKGVRPDAAGVGADTHLLGPNAVLDSVGFVTLLIAVEGNLGNAVDLSTSFLEQNGVDAAGSPFSTVGLLADHIGALLTKS